MLFVCHNGSHCLCVIFFCFDLEKMTAVQLAVNKETEKKAKMTNFSSSEIAMLTEKVEEILSVIQSPFTNTVSSTI